jgi:hypothetical protein
MRIRILKDFSKATDFLNGNFSAPTHWPEWNVLVSKHFKTDFYYYGAYEGHDLIGICPVHEVKNGILSSLYSGQFHYIPNGGWILSQKRFISDKEIRLGRFASFYSSTLPIINEFKVVYNVKRKMLMKTLIVMNDKLGNFYTFYRQANIKYQLPILPEDFFYELLNKVQTVNFDVLCAKKDEEPFGIAVIAYDKNYAFYWLGITIENKPNLGQGELLQWEAIKKTKKCGCKFYDLCYIEKERLPHIYAFKKGFSNTEADIVLASKKSFGYKVVNRLKKWF